MCEVVDDAAQPVVAGQAAAGLDPHDRRRQVELVVDDDQLRRVLDAVAAHQRPHRLARSRSCTSAGRRAPPDRSRDRALGDQRIVAARLAACAPCARGQHADDLLADVVARAGVLLAGVAQPDDQPVERGRCAVTRRRRVGDVGSLGGVAVGGGVAALGRLASPPSASASSALGLGGVDPRRLGRMTSTVTTACRDRRPR